MHDLRVGIVIPCFKCKAQILDVISGIGPYAEKIFVVDDFCPENTGKFVTDNVRDPRVKVLFHEKNMGVGGAVLTGYSAGISEGLDVLVKIDGDGQMDPKLAPKFITPIARGLADYTKGNRFHSIEHLHQMPLARIIGNAGLSFMSKLSSGYWELFDPTNGYTAVHTNVLKEINFSKVRRRFFFESDLLFRLYIARAVIREVSMSSHYADERSNLNILKTIPEFSYLHLVNFLKRIFYSYFLRNFSVASLELIGGLILVIFGLSYGIIHWISAIQTKVEATSGEVMLAALSILLGVQFLLNFLNYDMSMVPKTPRQLDI